MRWELIFSFILFIAALLVASILFYDLPINDIEAFIIPEDSNASVVNELMIDKFPNGTLFFDNIRFASGNISYSLDPVCTENRVNDSREAFDILEENTVLDFSEISKNGEILVSCSELEFEPIDDYFIAGEGGPNFILNTSKYYIIKNGTILLHKDNYCSEPVVALHEILHVLGFKHSSNEESVMYEISNCKQKLTGDIINIINSLYSDPSRPDLLMKKAEAFKSGRKLDFKLDILNIGLAESAKSSFAVFDGDKKIVEYDLDRLDIGAGKIITVSGLRVRGSLKTLKFFVDHENQIVEIDEANNQITLVLE